MWVKILSKHSTVEVGESQGDGRFNVRTLAASASNTYEEVSKV